MGRNLRCWYYDETGQGSCPNSGKCGFVHPSDPEWETSYFRERKSTVSVRGRGGGFSGSTQDHRSRPRRSTDNAGPSSSSVSLKSPWTSSKQTETSAWDADDGSWGGCSTAISDSSTTRSAEPSSGGWDGWGNDASKSKSNTAEERAGQGWGTTSGSSWGNAFSAENLRGEDSDKQNQDLSTTSDKGKGKMQDSWGSGSGWGNTTSEWGKTFTAEDLSGERTETCSAKGKGKSGDGWGDDSGSTWGKAFSAENLGRDDIGIQDVSRIPSDMGKGKEKITRNTLNIGATKHIQMSTSLEPLTPVSPQVGRHSSVQSGREARGYVRPIPAGPNARREQWEKTLRYFTAAVHAYQTLQEATKTRNRYKRLQHTPGLARSGPATTDKLDALNIANKKRMTEAEKAYEDRLDKLMELPDVSSAFLDMTTRVDEKELKRYTEDGKTWVEDVRKKVREVCAGMPPASQGRAGSVEDGELDLEDGNLKNGIIPAKRPLNDESASRSLSVYEALEQRISNAFDALETVQAKMEVAPKVDVQATTMEEKQKTVNQAANAANTLVLDNLKLMDTIQGETVTRQAEKTASVVTSHRQAEQLVQAIREQNEGKRSKLSQAQENIANLKKQVEQQAADRRMLEEKIQILLGKRPPPPLTLSPELVAKATAAATLVIQQVVNPVMDSLHAKILEELKVHQEENWKQAWNHMQKPLAVVEHVHGWLKSVSQK